MLSKSFLVNLLQSFTPGNLASYSSFCCRLTTLSHSLAKGSSVVILLLSWPNGSAHSSLERNFATNFQKKFLPEKKNCVHKSGAPPTSKLSQKFRPLSFPRSLLEHFMGPRRLQPNHKVHTLELLFKA